MNRLTQAFAAIDRQKRDKRRRSFKTWAKRTFANPDFAVCHHEFNYLVGNRVVSLDWLVATPKCWSRLPYAATGGWTTHRIGPLLLIALRLFAH